MSKNKEKMTLQEAVRYCLEHSDNDHDTWPNLVAYAYWAGRESKARELGNRISDKIERQKERACKSRYWKQALEIVGPEDYLYDVDYSMTFTDTFCNDKTELINNLKSDLVGLEYDDPEGRWIITDVSGNIVHVRCTDSKVESNIGFEGVVRRAEAEYFLNRKTT